MALKYLVTFPGIIISPIPVNTARNLLNTSKPGTKDFTAGLYKFVDLKESDAQAMVGRHRRFGYFKFPIIGQEQAQKEKTWDPKEQVSRQQAWAKSAKESLMTACYAVDANFNPNLDYVYVKVDF